RPGAFRPRRLLSPAGHSWQHRNERATYRDQGLAGAQERPMSRKRRSHEAGHRRKDLVVIDDTPECDRAGYWASQRAARTNSTLVMLRVIETHDRNQQWLGVADIMKAEAHEEANAALDKFASRANGVAGLTPERAVREGEVAEEILNLIE